jgi:hypothetical protein
MVSAPYTHADHARFIRESVNDSATAVKDCMRLVQVRKNKVVYCARIADAFTIPNGPDCWKVESFIPEKAIFSVPVSNVRVCGQGCKCTA